MPRQSHLPDIFTGRIAQDIDTVITPPDFEITMRGIEPSIKHLHDFDAPLTEVKAHRGLLGTITGITLYL